MKCKNKHNNILRNDDLIIIKILSNKLTHLLFKIVSSVKNPKNIVLNGNNLMFFIIQDICYYFELVKLLKKCILNTYGKSF